MKSNKLLVAASLLALLALTGCFEKSAEYYAANQSEAIEVYKKCKEKGMARLQDKNCMNAVRGNAMAEREKENIAAKVRGEALQKWQDDAAAANKKK